MRKPNRPTYRRPYPNWIDAAYALPRGYKVSNFAKITEKENREEEVTAKRKYGIGDFGTRGKGGRGGDQSSSSRRASPPLFRTTQSEGMLPLFVSSLSFNGELYTGCTSRNKRETEQLGPCTVIQSILRTYSILVYLNQE
ncbi:hypothetical protein NE237_005925 [Protea cynaroides]|uniref:Uncharacterized protein n=1 Tax=Protea cynaroides TaxID=273540 RepID=A0A9Q0KM58_9MAGN|nr:hypothetical protein NE237_005925 [Protea cynaroides]